MKRGYYVTLLFVLFTFNFFRVDALSENNSQFTNTEINSSFSAKLDDVYSYVKYYIYLDKAVTVQISALVSEWGETLSNDKYTGLGISLHDEKSELAIYSWLIKTNDREEHFLVTDELQSGVYVLFFDNSLVEKIVFSWSINVSNPVIWSYNSLLDFSQTNKLFFSLERIPGSFTELKKLYIGIDFYGKNISSLDLTIRDASNGTIFQENYQGQISSIDSQLKLEKSIKTKEWFSIIFNETATTPPSSFASIRLFYDHVSEVNCVRLFLKKANDSISNIPLDFNNEYNFKIDKWYNSGAFLSLVNILLIILYYVLIIGLPLLIILTIIYIVLRKKEKEVEHEILEYPSPKYKKAQYCPENAIRVDFSSIPDNYRLVGASNVKPKCNICLQSIDNLDNSIRCPSCDNIFHKNHLYQWIIQNGTCPTCKAKLRIAV